MTILRNLIFLAVLGATFLFGASAEAARITSIPSTLSFRVGSIFEVPILLDTEHTTINAIEGEVHFPDALLDVVETRDGNSPVSPWLVRPYRATAGTVSFSGIIPGGYDGNQRKLFSILFQAKANGTGAIVLGPFRAFANDGKGTPVEIASSSTSVHISDAFPTSTSPLPRDTVPPEPFVPEISRDQSMFDNQYFLVFHTTDKGVGLNHYEVLETPHGVGGGNVYAWQETKSPYALRDQTLLSDIYVRATDNTGNFIIVGASSSSIERARGSEEYQVSLALVAGLMVVWCIWIIVKRAYARKRKR